MPDRMSNRIGEVDPVSAGAKHADDRIRAPHRGPRRAAGKPATDAGGKAGRPDKAAAGSANIYETESQTVSDF